MSHFIRSHFLEVSTETYKNFVPVIIDASQMVAGSQDRNYQGPPLNYNISAADEYADKFAHMLVSVLKQKGLKISAWPEGDNITDYFHRYESVFPELRKGFMVSGKDKTADQVLEIFEDAYEQVKNTIGNPQMHDVDGNPLPEKTHPRVNTGGGRAAKRDR